MGIIAMNTAQCGSALFRYVPLPWNLFLGIHYSQTWRAYPRERHVLDAETRTMLGNLASTLPDSAVDTQVCPYERG